MPVHGDTRRIELSDPAQLQGVYEALEESIKVCDFQATFQQKIFPELERAESQFFASEVSPGGTPWPALKQSTIDKKGHDIILVETGRLKASLTGQTGDSVRDAESNFGAFGTSVPYSHFHQDGGARLPQREHVGLNDELLDIICDKIGDAVI